VLTNFDHDRQWFNTLISPSDESAAVTVDCISLLSRPVELALRYTTVDIHCKDRRYKCDGGISRPSVVTMYALYKFTTDSDSHIKHLPQPQTVVGKQVRPRKSNDLVLISLYTPAPARSV